MTVEASETAATRPAGEPLSVAVATDGEVTTLRVAGEIDLLTATTLQRPLDLAIRAGGPLVLDLTHVEFVDSTGLRLLLETRNKARDRLTLVLGEGLPVRRLLDVTGVLGLFRIA